MLGVFQVCVVHFPVRHSSALSLSRRRRYTRVGPFAPPLPAKGPTSVIAHSSHNVESAVSFAAALAWTSATFSGTAAARTR